MALAYYGQSNTQGLVLGLSTDTKPLSPAASMFFLELDTGKQFNVQGGAWAPTYTSSVVKQIEVDFGGVPIKMKKFTITDAAVIPGCKITPTLSYDDPSDGETDSAEWFETITMMARAGTGQFYLYCNSLYQDLVGKAKINYILS